MTNPDRPRIPLTPEMKEIKRKLANEKMRLYVAEKRRLLSRERNEASELARLEKASAVGTHSVEALPPAQLPPIARQEAPILCERSEASERAPQPEPLSLVKATPEHPIPPENISWLDSGDPVLKDRRRVSGTDILNGYSPYAARS